MLVYAVVVAGDGTRADVNVIPNISITKVGEMTSFRAFAEMRFFDFDEIADMRAFSQFSAGAQTGERPDRTTAFQHRIFEHAVRTDFTVIANHAIFQHAARTDFDAVTQFHVTFDNDIGVDQYIDAVRQFTAQIKPRWVHQHHAFEQQTLCLFTLIYALKTGKLQAVIHTIHFAVSRRMNGGDQMSFRMRHRNNIGDVVFTLRIVVIQLPEPAFE